jgi:hypothetical protein
LRALLILLACSVSLLAQPGATFKIAGRVVRHADNHPVNRARVSIAMVDHPDRQASCLTGDKGEFLFTGLSQAKYSLQVHDHRSAQYFQQSDNYWTGIAVGPDLDSEHIEFALESPARITGSVLDEVGDPVPGAELHLFAQSLVNGRFQTLLNSQTNTGPDGDFRFTHLTPGTYYVGVTGRPWYAQTPHRAIRDLAAGLLRGAIAAAPETRSDLDLTYPIVFYDGRATADSATPLKLEEGAIIEIHFTLHAVPALHIGVEGYQGQDGQQLNPQLSHVGPGGIPIPAAAAFDGSLFAVAPGSYIVSPTIFRPDQPFATLGSQTVNLTSDSIIQLSDMAQTSVKGKVTFDGALPPSLSLSLGNLGNGTQVDGIVRPDGTFDLTSVLPGRYALQLNAADVYVQSVKVEGGVFKTGVLTIVKGAAMELTISAAKGLTNLNGTVVKGTQAIAGAMVLLWPQDSNRAAFIPRDQSDSDGTFTLKAVPPGRYTLLAIDNGRGLPYADPAVIAPYLQAGRVLDLPLNNEAKVEIEVQSRR